MSSTALHAQDKIIRSDGNEIKAKILEIDGPLIKYREEDDQSGPIRHINRSNIFMIIYANGKREYFQPTQPTTATDNQGYLTQPEEVASLPAIEVPKYELLPNITPPPPEHAVLYFIRPSIVGFAVPLVLFHENKVISTLKAKSYERHIIPAGTYHFSIANTTDNTFITTHLRAGGIYFVRINGLNGDIVPIDANHKEFIKLLKFISDKEPFVSNADKLQGEAKKYSKIMERKLNRFIESTRHGITQEIMILEADMAIPYELLRKTELHTN